MIIDQQILVGLLPKRRSPHACGYIWEGATPLTTENRASRVFPVCGVRESEGC